MKRPTVTITLDLADALSVGETLRALAKTHRVHVSVAAALQRVGEQLVHAASTTTPAEVVA